MENGEIWDFLRFFGGDFGIFWGVLGARGQSPSTLRVPGEGLGTFWGQFRGFWDILGWRFWGFLGFFGDFFGVFFGVFLGVLGGIWGLRDPLGRSPSTLRVPGGFGDILGTIPGILGHLGTISGILGWRFWAKFGIFLGFLGFFWVFFGVLGGIWGLRDPLGRSPSTLRVPGGFGDIWGQFRGFWDILGSRFWDFWGFFGVFFGFFWDIGRDFGAFRDPLGRTLCTLRVPGEGLGTFWGHFGTISGILGHLGTISGILGWRFWGFWDFFGVFLGFGGNFLGFWEGFGALRDPLGRSPSTLWVPGGFGDNSGDFGTFWDNLGDGKWRNLGFFGVFLGFSGVFFGFFGVDFGVFGGSGTPWARAPPPSGCQVGLGTFWGQFRGFWDILGWRFWDFLGFFGVFFGVFLGF
ncbi:uncharacterized protein [Agelaius tricolor]|uniref:uncharacterized protein n=1 Tax=Agelaius tricolor TaxID=9191 RepID=UPI0039F20905